MACCKEIVFLHGWGDTTPSCHELADILPHGVNLHVRGFVGGPTFASVQAHLNLCVRNDAETRFPRIIQVGITTKLTVVMLSLATSSSKHPAGGKIEGTKLQAFLDELRKRAIDNGPFLAVFGYSFGGFLAALFQEQCPGLVQRVVLLAPAIDNFERCRC